MSATDDRIVELVARLVVLEAFDKFRARRPFDMGAGRRRYAIRRIDSELIRRGIDPLGVTDETVDRGELERAFARECGARLCREFVTDAVYLALRDAADELELDYPDVLHDYISGRRDSYPAGASRARR